MSCDETFTIINESRYEKASDGQQKYPNVQYLSKHYIINLFEQVCLKHQWDALERIVALGSRGTVIVSDNGSVSITAGDEISD